MKHLGFLFLLCLGALAFAAGGCAVADQGAFVRLQEDVESVRKEVAAAKSSAASQPIYTPARTDSGEIQSVRKNLADLTSSYDQVKSDIVVLTTRTDETKVQMQKEISRLNDRLDEQVQLNQELRKKLARLEEIERRMAAMEEKGDKPGAAGPAAVSPSATVPQDWKSPEEMYDYALGLVKGGESRKGREVLAAFVAKYPDHKLMPNVLYWKGESFYTEKDYESAILSFQDVIDKYPSGDKAPDAMYKQGLSFMALKDSKNARILFELLSKKYPKSPASSLAQQKLTEMK